MFELCDLFCCLPLDPINQSDGNHAFCNLVEPPRAYPSSINRQLGPTPQLAHQPVPAKASPVGGRAPREKPKKESDQRKRVTWPWPTEPDPIKKPNKLQNPALILHALISRSLAHAAGDESTSKLKKRREKRREKKKPTPSSPFSRSAPPPPPPRDPPPRLPVRAPIRPPPARDPPPPSCCHSHGVCFFFSVRCRSGIGGGGAPGGLWSRGRRRRRVWSGATRWLRRRRGLGRITTTSSSSSSSGTAVGDTTSSLDLAFPFPFHGEWCRVGFPAPRCWLDRRWIGPREQLGSCKGFAFGVRLCAWSVFHVNLVSVQPTIYIMPTCLVHTGRNYHYCALCKKKEKEEEEAKLGVMKMARRKKKWISWFSKFFLRWKNLGNGQLELQAFLIKLILRLFRQCARPSEKRCT